MNDLYYSGHISNGIIFCYATLLLWRRYPKSKFAFGAFVFWVFFHIPYTWLIMTILRTHYFIDDYTALGCGVTFVLVGEKLSYIVDVLILGLPTQKRALFFHKVCPACGWCTWRPINYIDKAEKRVQYNLYKGKVGALSESRTTDKKND